jgi:7-keto-8-aminopelargonate synthetase-like enzyme
MFPQLEATMAHGRAMGITQRTVREASPDGRLLVLEPDGVEVLSFATCSYLGLDRDLRLTSAAIAAMGRCGVSFSASRCFLQSPLVAEAEALLERIFARPVVVAGSTTLVHGAALPLLIEGRDVVLYDQQVHHSVQTALLSVRSVEPPVSVPHADLERVDRAVREAVARGARRVWYCADGVYSMFGDRLDVDGLVALMEQHPQLWAYLDDAHGMSWCGARGAGTLVDTRLPTDRTVIATSLSKGFGAGGGLVAVPDRHTQHRIQNLGPSLMFGIQAPPPVLGAVCASAAIHLSPEIGALQADLRSALRRMRELLEEDEALASRVPVRPTSPVHYLALGDIERTVAVSRRLVERGILVNPVAFPAVPRSSAGIRWTLTRSHTADDLLRLASELGDAVRATARTAPPRRAMAAGSL